jgi:hypothetical protein
MSVQSKRIAWGLAGLIVSLILVGVVSGTPVRHLIQVLPGSLALVMVARRAPGAGYAALSVFLFWLFIMVLIWLWLLGLASIVNGTFSRPEVVLTFTIGISCLWGLVACVRAPSAASHLIRVLMAMLFAALQIGAMWMSLRPAFARI